MTEKEFDIKALWKKFSTDKNPEDYTKQQLGAMYDRDIKLLNTIWILLCFAAMASSFSLSAAFHEKACNEFLIEEYERLGLISNPFDNLTFNVSLFNVDMPVVPVSQDVNDTDNGQRQETNNE